MKTKTFTAQALNIVWLRFYFIYFVHCFHIFGLNKVKFQKWARVQSIQM